MIGELRQTLQSRGVTIQDLFSAEEIAAAMPPGSLLGRRVGGYTNLGKVPKLPKLRKTGGGGNWVRQKTGQVLIEVKQEGLIPFPYQSDMLLLRLAVLQHCLRLRA